MKKSLNVLIVEDSQDDADMVVHELRRAGFDPKWQRVEAEPAFLAELKNSPDIVLSDYSMPEFSGLRAAELLQQSGLNIPFILISGTVGEDVAVEAMKHGATDYLLKDRIARLGPAVERALEQKELRQQRQQADNELRQSEHRFREMLENLKLIAMTLDKQGRVTFCNDYLLELTGYKREEIVGAGWFEKFIPESDTDLKKLFFDTAAIGAIPPHHQNSIKTVSGELRDILWNNTTLRDGGGNIIGTASIGEDVTERKQAEQALRESEEKFRQVAENINEVFWMTDPTMHETIYVSPAYEKIWGRSCESLYASPREWLEAIHSEDREQVLKAATEMQTSGLYDVEYRIIRPDKKVCWIHDRAFPVRNTAGEFYRIVGTAEDITERKRAEKKLRQLSHAVEQSPVSVVITDIKGNIEYVNRKFTEVTGYSPAEIFGKNPRLLKSGEMPVEAYQQLWKTISKGGTWSGEFHNRKKNGELYWESASISPIFDDTGKPTHYVAVKEDMTERHRAEKALRESEERFRLVTENASDLITVINNEGVIRFQSPSVERILGYKPEDWLNRNAFEFVHPEDVTAAAAALQRKVNEPDRPPILVDFRMRHHDGSWRIMQVIGQSIPKQKSEGFIVLNSRDITENRRLEEQFRQSQKMEAFGQLAGGVAHDFNNILAVIQMQAGMLRMEQDLSQIQMDYATEIEKSAQRAANLTRQLLMFSRRQSMQPRDVNLNEVISNMTKMLHRIIGEDIQMHLKYAPQQPCIHADAGMMDQVLLNLTVNCRDAMPKGGDLFLETSLVEFDELAVAQSYKARPGQFACLTVSDTGCGIPPEILPRIFEPFFTTKDVGKGTGLGLATVFGIVQQHQGWINVYSEAGHGTTFRIYLPVSLQAADQQSLPPALESMRGGDETILLVEDDSSLRISVRNALSRLGYHVLEAHTGFNALEMWHQHRDKIGLLFTDMVMPDGMTGKELAEKLLQLNPKLKVIYTSGYSADVASRDILLDEGVNFLAKPFEAHVLAQTVRACLNKS
jgi:nitrogen fixation negative regulator NifL